MVGTDFWPTPRRIFTFLHIYAKDAEFRRRARKFYNWDANGVTEWKGMSCPPLLPYSTTYDVVGGTVFFQSSVFFEVRVLGKTCGQWSELRALPKLNTALPTMPVRGRVAGAKIEIFEKCF